MNNYSANSHWWLDAWWEEDNWVSQSKYTLDEIRASIDVLKTVFTAEWAEKVGNNDVANIFLRNVRYGKSIWQHRYIVRLGKQISDLLNRPGFNSILSRLLSTNESESADMELSLAALLLEYSYEVNFPVPNSKRGKSPDIVASNGVEMVAFECKQLETSNKQRWLNSYYQHVSRILRDSLDNKERHIQFEFDEPPIDQFFNQDGIAIQDPRVVAEETARYMVTYVRSLFVESQSPLLFGVEGIGYGRFIGTTVPNSAWMQHPSMSDDRLFARMFSNGIKRANEQLRAMDCPGIAAIYAEDSPSFEYAQNQFENKVRQGPADYEHLTACLVFQRQALFHYQPPHLLINPVSRTKFSELNISNIIRKAYGL